MNACQQDSYLSSLQVDEISLRDSKPRRSAQIRRIHSQLNQRKVRLSASFDEICLSVYKTQLFFANVSTTNLRTTISIQYSNGSSHAQ